MLLTFQQPQVQLDVCLAAFCLAVANNWASGQFHSFLAQSPFLFFLLASSINVIFGLFASVFMTVEAGALSSGVYSGHEP